MRFEVIARFRADKHLFMPGDIHEAPPEADAIVWRWVDAGLVKPIEDETDTDEDSPEAADIAP